MLSGIAWCTYENADFGVAGRVLGETPLGNYTVAWTISSALVEKITNLITGVTPAYSSAVQTDKTELRRYLLRLTEVMALLTVPGDCWNRTHGGPVRTVFLRPKWYGVIGPLRLLGIFIASRSLMTILPNLLTAVGDARFVMWVMISCLIVMPVAFYLGRLLIDYGSSCLTCPRGISSELSGPGRLQAWWVSPMSCGRTIAASSRTKEKPRRGVGMLTCKPSRVDSRSK